MQLRQNHVVGGESKQRLNRKGKYFESGQGVQKRQVA